MNTIMLPFSLYLNEIKWVKIVYFCLEIYSWKHIFCRLHCCYYFISRFHYFFSVLLRHIMNNDFDMEFVKLQFNAFLCSPQFMCIFEIAGIISILSWFCKHLIGAFIEKLKCNFDVFVCARNFDIEFGTKLFNFPV